MGLLFVHRIACRANDSALDERSRVNMDQLTTPHQTLAGVGLGLVETNQGESLSGTRTETPLPGEVAVIPLSVISMDTKAFVLSQDPT